MGLRVGIRGPLALAAAAVVVLSSTSASPASRTSRVAVVGLQQDVNGFNTSLSCCSRPSANEFPVSAVLHGAFTQNARGEWVKDLVSAASATAQTLSYTIRKGASWYWGGRRIPITYRDFVYTLQQLDNPANNIATRSGYDQIDSTRFSHAGARRVTFFWRTQDCSTDAPCGPYGDWRSLFAFGSLYPALALTGVDFNVAWAHCICGSDGKPVSDGPFYLSNYTAGESITLKRNPYWWGRRAGLAEIEFKIVPDGLDEVRQLQTGELDAIAPSFGQYLLALRNHAGLRFQLTPGYSAEHLEFNIGGGSSNPLLRAPWMRKAISLGIDRKAIIQTLYGQLAGSVKPLNSLLFFSGEAPYRADFAALSYNPRKALAILRRHCSGGPSEPSAVNSTTWACSGFPAQFGFLWTVGDAMRSVQEAMIESQLKAIGIGLERRPIAASAFFGPNGIAGGAFDIADFALNTTGNPSALADVWQCNSTINFLKYCNLRVTTLLDAAAAEPNGSKAMRDYQAADRLLAVDIPALPLYQRPQVLVSRTKLAGPADNPGPLGPYGNIGTWRWQR
jgi:peptide/nickel transport system substrate-binding protein